MRTFWLLVATSLTISGCVTSDGSADPFFCEPLNGEGAPEERQAEAEVRMDQFDELIRTKAAYELRSWIIDVDYVCKANNAMRSE